MSGDNFRNISMKGLLVPDALCAGHSVFDSIREVEVMCSKLKEGYKKVSGQLHMRNRNGEERWVEIAVQPFSMKREEPLKGNRYFKGYQ